MKRMTKQLLTAVLSAATAAASFSALTYGEAAQDASAAFVPGTYETTVAGHHGDLTVEVTFSEDAIQDVNVTKNTDTHFISEPAIEAIANNVIKYQTGNVDTVAGATLSSMALKRGINSLIEEAGADPEALGQMPAAEEISAEDEEFDIVIVGAGTAGITAAITAASDENKEENGLRVLLLEKMPFAGGSFIVSGAGIFNCTDTDAHKAGEADIIDEDTFVDYFNYRSNNDRLGITNEGLQRLVYQAIDPAERLLMDAGAPFTMAGDGGAEPMDMTFEGYSNNALVDICYPAGVYAEMEAKFYEENGYGSTADIAGEAFTGVLNKYSNIELRKNSSAVGIEAEDGNVTGIKVETKDLDQNTVSTYTVRAKKFILATGSPQLNDEILEQYDPDFAKAYAFCEAGQTGDGITMLQDAGLDPVIQGQGGMCYNGVSFGYAMEDGLALNDIGAPVVNKSGERYYDEALTAPYDTGKYTREQEDNTGYIILDSRSAFFNGTDLWYYEGLKEPDEILYDYIVRKGWAVKADTLEELADLIDVDKETFLTTIENFNKAAHGEIEDELAAVPEYMIPVEEGPFYALTTHAFRIESYVSLKTADGSTQIVSASGDPIGNLYGAGTLIVSNVYYDNYFNYDGGLTTGLAMGYVAGEEVKNAIS